MPPNLSVAFLLLLASQYQVAGEACYSLACVSELYSIGALAVGVFTGFVKINCKSAKIFKTRKTKLFFFFYEQPG